MEIKPTKRMEKAKQRGRIGAVIAATAAATSLLWALSDMVLTERPMSEPAQPQEKATAPARCPETKCPPCHKQRRRRRRAPISRQKGPTNPQKIDQISTSIRKFYNADENGRLKLTSRNFQDHIKFLKTARYGNGEGSEGELMFPGIAASIQDRAEYGCEEVRLMIARSFLDMFGRKAREMPSVVKIMGKMPNMLTATVASRVISGQEASRLLNAHAIEEPDPQLDAMIFRDDGQRRIFIGDSNRAMLRKNVREEKMRVYERLERNSAFMLALGESVEAGHNREEAHKLSESDWADMDNDVTARILGWHVKRWWVDADVWRGGKLQVWDVTQRWQLARYICSRMRTYFHGEMPNWGKNCSSVMRSYGDMPAGVGLVRFDDLCAMRHQECPQESGGTPASEYMINTHWEEQALSRKGQWYPKRTIRR